MSSSSSAIPRLLNGDAEELCRVERRLASLLPESAAVHANLRLNAARIPQGMEFYRARLSAGSTGCEVVFAVDYEDDLGVQTLAVFTQKPSKEAATEVNLVHCNVLGILLPEINKKS